MERLFVGLMQLSLPILIILNLIAFYEGMNVWLGWGFFATFLVMLVSFAFRDIGALFMAVVAFVGMWKGWEWPFIVAFALAFPVIVATFALMLGGGAVKVLTRRSHG